MFYSNAISVIIPTFNRLPYLYGTVFCLLNQNNTKNIKYEIIVVDSGDEEAKTLIKQFQSTGKVSIVYKRVKNCKNRARLRNIGAQLARYNILCFLDNDMLVAPNFIERCFEYYKKQADLVLLGCRKSLTNFKIENIDLGILRKNFSILEKLGYYNDERVKTFSNIEKWRFVFSHTLLMPKSLFFMVEKFNNEFGKYWGFEDLELGFRIQQSGAVIKLADDIASYHQPHFSQSYTEQAKMRTNGYLFLKLHNCAEVELYQCFYSDFNKYYSNINEAKKLFIHPTKAQLKQYDLIFGCIFLSNEKQKSKKMFLGAINYNKTASVDKVLLNDTFFNLPKIIQQSVITESFRIGNRVYIESDDETKKLLVSKTASDAGLVVNSIVKKNLTEFVKRGTKKSNVFIIYIPNIFETEKRFVFLWLASYLIQKGYFIDVKDTFSTDNFSYDDFKLDEKDRKLIEANLNKSYGQTKVQFIISTTMLLNKLHTGIPNADNSYILKDMDFENLNISKEYLGFENAIHFDDSVFSLLTFIATYSCIKDIKLLENQKNDSYCCFMENGFYEDGIDIILKGFSEIIKVSSEEKKLTIKIPDYSQFKNAVFPLHNEESKNTKLFSKHQAAIYEKALLKEHIKSLQLENNIIIITQNMALRDIANLVNESSCLIYVSRGIRVSPVVYLSILLKKRTVICSHHKLIGDLDSFCSVAESRLETFHKALHIPSTDRNIMQNAYSTNTDSLLHAINAQCNKLRDKKIVTKLINKAEELFASFLE